jgi:hypothetical protein
MAAPSAAPAAPPSPAHITAAALDGVPPLAGPLPPLTRPLVPVLLLQTKAGIVHVPQGASKRREWVGLTPPEIISIHGRSPQDVWFLTGEGVVFQDNGERIVSRHVRPCGWGEHIESNSAGTRFYQIVVDKESVRVLGESRDLNTRIGGDVTATLSKLGKWSCKSEGLVPAIATSSGEHTWKAAHNFSDDLCRLRVSDGPCASAPAWAPSFVEPSGDAIDMGVHHTALWMHGLDDGWMVTWGGDGRQWLHRYNGVAWAPVATIEKGIRVIDMWADEERHAWLTVRRGDGRDGPANLVLRFDGDALRPLPVPASFATGLVRGTGPRDVWFAGAGRTVYQWDGERLRQGEAPFDASYAWSSPGGEVWMVGEGQVAHTAPLGEAR